MPRYLIREDVVMYGTAYHYVCAANESEARQRFRDGEADYDETDWGDEDATGEFEVEEEECRTGCDDEDTEDCPDYEEPDEDDEDQPHCNKCKWRKEDSRSCAHRRGWIQDETMTNNNPDEGWAAKCENYEEGDSEDDEDSDTPVAEDPLAFLD